MFFVLLDAKKQKKIFLVSLTGSTLLFCDKTQMFVFFADLQHDYINDALLSDQVTPLSFLFKITLNNFDPRSEPVQLILSFHYEEAC